MVGYLDFLYFFVPLFAFSAIVELIHFLPFVRRITEKEVYDKMYGPMIVFLISFLVWDISFLVDIFLGNRTLHKLLEVLAMGIVLLETIRLVRKNVVELQVIKTTKEVIERSEKKYRNLIETMNDGFWLIDENQTSTMVNEKMGEMLGYTPEEIIGKKITLFLDTEAQTKVKKQLESRPKGKSSTYEIELTKKNGSKSPVVVSGSPIFDDDRKYIGSFGIMTDVSRLKQLEGKIRSYSEDLEKMVGERTDDLLQAQDSVLNMLEDLTDSKEELAKAYDNLKDVDRLKTDILSNISHELRTPITIAKCAIELTRGEDDDKEIDKFLSMCENALTRLNDLVENLVDISLLYKGQFLVLSSAVDLYSVIEETIGNYKVRTKEKKIKLINISKNNSLKVLGDKKAISRTITAIIDNAVKFTNESGKITIDVKKDGEFVQIIIKDTGPGIEQKYKEKIFEPFYQIDPTTTREYGGVGIGLALAKSNLAAQKGRIWVESTPGKGSTFYIKLPLAREKDL
jgi:PAS domain S-box-containing protein